MKKGKCKQSEIGLHTSDRKVYKRCRRKWDFSSPFRQHLESFRFDDFVKINDKFWYGSGIHFALEDYHGYNIFKNPVDAYMAYFNAHDIEERPDNADELADLGISILMYYIDWQRRKMPQYKTVWQDGKPLIEVSFSLVLDDLCYWKVKDSDPEIRVVPFDDEDDPSMFVIEKDSNILSTYDSYDINECEYVEIVYHGTIDRIVEDQDGRWWVLDYKTAIKFDNSNTMLDQQISTYCWAIEQWLEKEVAGMVWLQLLKKEPKGGRILKKGVSVAKNQLTTYTLYRQTLIDYYGSLDDTPTEQLMFLDETLTWEDEYGDKFIQYLPVDRGRATKINQYKHILEEGKEMLNPNISIYPNPTRDCSWDCDFRHICIAMEEGADWEFILDSSFQKKEKSRSEEGIPKWKLRLAINNKEFAEKYKIDTSKVGVI